MGHLQSADTPIIPGKQSYADNVFREKISEIAYGLKSSRWKIPFNPRQSTVSGIIITVVIVIIIVTVVLITVFPLIAVVVVVINWQDLIRILIVTR